jgi:asparagine synthase (glutamine-hydrolysing)
VALPDHAAAEAVAKDMAHSATSGVAHASGRAWLLGSWDDEVRIIRVGEYSIAIAGGRAADDPELRRVVVQALRSSRHEILFAQVSVPVVVYASLPGKMLVLTETSGLRSAFHARHAGTTVVADRADTLARLVGAPVDEAWLAARLTTNGLPPPCRFRSPFLGVGGVPPGHVLTVGRDGDAGLTRWWSPPPPTVPLRQAARQFGERLANATTAPAADAKVVSCDLSGGLDSTSLAFVLAGSAPASSLVLTTLGSIQAGHPDLRWARSAAARLADGRADVRHVEIDPVGCPDVFSGLESAPATDEPDGMLAFPARLRFYDDVLSDLRSDLHVTGHGGDEVTRPLPGGHLAATIRRHPVAGTRQLHGFSALLGRRALPEFRELARPRSYGDWLAGSAKRLLAADAGIRRDRLWGPPPRLPAWVTARTRTLVHDLLLDGGGAEPLSPVPSQHCTLNRVHAAARSRRLAGQMQTNPSKISPFLSREILDVALSVRPHEMNTPRQFKPLLVAAMRDTVPHDLLDRATKGHYDADVAAGLRRHMADVRGFLLDGLLVEHGILDRVRVGRTLRIPFPIDVSLSAVVTAVGCEAWFRRHISAHPVAGR